MLCELRVCVSVYVSVEVYLSFHEPFYRSIEIRQFQIANQFMTFRMFVSREFLFPFQVCTIFSLSLSSNFIFIPIIFRFFYYCYSLNKHNINIINKRTQIFCTNLLIIRYKPIQFVCNLIFYIH